MRIDVRGKIVLARYGASWRGIKPKVAAEHGAVGCLIYSDPRDDGYFEGDVYPLGAYRPEQGVQRGSVADMPLYPGDPLTPGVGATKDARRLDRKDARTLTKIPVLPISYGDARPLLAALGGRTAPREWRGGLPVSYHIGPGPATVHLKLAFDWKMVPAHDVIARIEGSPWPDEWVIHGNHHDAWVNGASDPVSGLAALLEEARSLGALLKTGWRPKRTIVLCAWDGEEPGLLGSTEWVETHADELTSKAVVYINTDSNGRGYLGVGGSHGLESLVNEVAGDVEDPEKKIPVGKRARLRQIEDSKTAEERHEARERKNLRISALGSGSDFTPFLQHLGIASLNLGYGGEGGGGVYHSIYDDFAWYTPFLGRRLRLRTGARADDGIVDAPPRQRRSAPLRLYEPGRDGQDVRQGASHPGRRQAGSERGENPADRGGSLLRAGGSSRAHGGRKARTGRTLFRFFTARERLREPDAGRPRVRARFRLGSGLGARTSGRRQCPHPIRGARHAPARRFAAPAVVQALSLRARVLHRLRRQDSSGGPGGDRREAVGGRQPGDRENRRDDRRLRRPDPRGGETACAWR